MAWGSPPYRSDRYGFVSGSVIAGVTLVAFAAGTTLSSTAGLINPVGSGVVVRLKGLSVASLATIMTVGKPIILGVQAGPATQPSTITKQPVVSTPFGTSYVGQAFTYSAATLNFASTHEVFDAIYYPFGNPQTVVGFQPTFAEFQDEIILNPGSNAALVGTTSLATVVNTWVWEEYPLQAV